MEDAVPVQEPPLWCFNVDLATAIYANCCLLSLQVMHQFAQAILAIALGPLAGTLKTARSLPENGNGASHCLDEGKQVNQNFKTRSPGLYRKCI
jgi:hypothetical protein